MSCLVWFIGIKFPYFLASFIFGAVLDQNVSAFNCDGVETFEVFQTGGGSERIFTHLGAAFGLAPAVCTC